MVNPKAKSGRSLATIAGFPPTWVEILRNELSVTTNAEFVDLASRFGPQLEKLLGADRDTLAGVVYLLKPGSPKLTAAEKTRVDFKTGHDMPKAGHQTFQD
jgi:hypothetical protein